MKGYSNLKYAMYTLCVILFCYVRTYEYWYTYAKSDSHIDITRMSLYRFTNMVAVTKHVIMTSVMVAKWKNLSLAVVKAYKSLNNQLKFHLYSLYL